MGAVRTPSVLTTIGPKSSRVSVEFTFKVGRGFECVSSGAGSAGISDMGKDCQVSKLQARFLSVVHGISWNDCEFLEKTMKRVCDSESHLSRALFTSGFVILFVASYHPEKSLLGRKHILTTTMLSLARPLASKAFARGLAWKMPGFGIATFYTLPELPYAYNVRLTFASLAHAYDLHAVFLFRPSSLIYQKRL